MSPIQNRFLSGLVSGSVGLLLLHALLTQQLGMAALKTESNYFTSLIRLQSAARSPAGLSLVGSSITGRLPGREAGNAEVANLATDGGSSIDGLLLMTWGVLPVGQAIVIETNSLQNLIEQGESPLTGAARRLWFRVGCLVPPLGAAARPSGLLYDRLLGRSRVAVGAAFPVESGPTILTPPGKLTSFNEVERKRLEEAAELICALRQQGARTFLVRYPSGGSSESFRVRLNHGTAWLSARTASPFLDLEAAIPRDRLRFTDDVHLMPESAAGVLATLRMHLTPECGLDPDCR